jgi:hypothetical protein
MTFLELAIVGGLLGGALGAGMSGMPGPTVNGVEQPYPHCRGVTVIDPNTPVDDFHGVVVDVTEIRPCIGQPVYELAHIDTGKKVVTVYLGPEKFLANHGVSVSTGGTMSVSVAQAGGYLTALSVDVNGQAVNLRDEHGRPLWEQPSRLAH